MLPRLVQPLAMLFLLGAGMAQAATGCLDANTGSRVECAAASVLVRGQMQVATLALADVRDGLRATESQPSVRAAETASSAPEALVPHTFALILAGVGAVAFMSGRRHR